MNISKTRDLQNRSHVSEFRTTGTAVEGKRSAPTLGFQRCQHAREDRFLESFVERRIDDSVGWRVDEKAVVI
eukprot:scaffold40763_cov61-Phaeocystis_antarctica.AAC.2